jgi:hypothetical protein
MTTEKVPPKIEQFSSRVWTISKERKRNIYQLFVLVAVDLATRSPCWTPIQPMQIPVDLRLPSESVAQCERRHVPKWEAVSSESGVAVTGRVFTSKWSIWSVSSFSGTP